jgi:predicted DsbA family dithiol-disulfide isomerase
VPPRLIVYSDYLCPWCYNGAVRLRRIGEELGAGVEIEWRSYLLRPRPDPRRTLEKFRAYTQSWLRPAADPDGGTFRVWEGDAGPPSHSIPPHLAAKAATSLGKDAFERLHLPLMHAYFAENRDITERATLRAVWTEVGLPEPEFDRIDDPDLLRLVVDEHNRAVEDGITGVPAVSLAGRDDFVIGAQPLDVYRRWLHRALVEEKA